MKAQLFPLSDFSLNEEIFVSTNKQGTIKEPKIIEAPITYSKEELEVIKLQAFQEGEKSGAEKQKTLGNIFEKKIEKTLKNLEAKLSLLSLEAKYEKDEIIAAAAALASAISHKLHPTISQPLIEEQICGFIDKHFDVLIGSYEISIIISEKNFSFLKPILDLKFAKLQSKVSIKASKELSDTDCIIDAGVTKIEKSSNEVKTKIEEILKEFTMINTLNK